MENTLKRGRVDDQQLTHEGTTHGNEEHAIGEQTNTQQGFGLQCTKRNFQKTAQREKKEMWYLT